jgi:hypothetical protein
MATTFVDYTGDGNATKSFSFPSYKESDIKVDVEGVIKTSGSHYNITSYTTTGGGNVVFTSGNIPASPANIRIYRDTDVDSAKATYTAGSSVKAGDLNNNNKQLLYAAQEEKNQTIQSSDIKDSAISNAKLGADAVTGAKIADDSINSEHYVDGSIDTAHIADSQITTAKIADGQVTTAKISNGDVTTAKIAADAITNAKIADDSIDSEHYVDGSIDTAHIADGQVTHVKLANDAVDGDNIADDSINSEHYVDGSIDTAHIASAQVTDAKLASNSVTTGKITDANVTTVKIADSNITLAKLASDLKQTTISDSDTQLPTSGAVVDYVAAQLQPFGGFEAVATELAFPNTQPASGVAISISDAGGVVFNGSGSSTTGRTVGGTTVTINNAPSSLNNETLVAGVGLIVTSTGSGQIYNYHKILGKESDIKQLSDDINDFNARYRVQAGEPGSNNDEGDLAYDTTANKMKVYDGSSWGEVASTGEFKFLFLCPAGGSGAPTINGSIATYDLRESSNSGTAADVTIAAQLLVSVNGVIQKANSGTSAPAEGFALVDANTIVFGTNLPTGADVFIIQIGSSVTVPTPGDGTVTAAKIGSGAVTTAKIADSAVTTVKVADDAVTLAKLAGLARGKIIYGDSSGNPAALSLGSSGQTLVSDGTDISWGDAAAGATGGGSDKIFWENGQTVTTNYTITNNYNAMSAGPITINNGIVVTIGTGENWTIV